MRAGKFVEVGGAEHFLRQPTHLYRKSCSRRFQRFRRAKSETALRARAAHGCQSMPRLG